MDSKQEPSERQALTQKMTGKTMAMTVGAPRPVSLSAHVAAKQAKQAERGRMKADRTACRVSHVH